MEYKKILFVDCQTTGMRPSSGSILEIAWIKGAGEERSFLLRLPGETFIPEKVKDLTGITENHLAKAVDPEEAFLALEADLAALGDGVRVVIHYSQFERAFLNNLYATLRSGAAFPAPLVCTHRIASRLYPEAPSRNIRALLGYLNLGEFEVRRAAAHARATALIWERFRVDLLKFGVRTFSDLDAWLREAKADRAAKTVFRLSRDRRLELPDRPGVYRMLSRSGRVLYVGKAASLRARVNSYFRGPSGKAPRIREMLAQVENISHVECASALEAALFENEEIKRLNPPYNISLKIGRRKLIFYSRDFLDSSFQQTTECSLGPFPSSGAVEAVRDLLVGLLGNGPAEIFSEWACEKDQLSALQLLRDRYDFCLKKRIDMRRLLALGGWLERIRRKTEKLVEQKSDEEECGKIKETAMDEASEGHDELLSPEELVHFYESILKRAGRQLFRARRLTRLLNCTVALDATAGLALEIRRGRIWRQGDAQAGGGSWVGLGLADYDRVSVLSSEIARNSYRVETKRPT